MQPWQHYLVYAGRYLETVHWSITGKCNFRCRHCLVSAPDAHHPQLPLEDCKHIIREIARCGVNRVDITGGEPLVRNDFEKIVKELSDHGIDIGTLFTNASIYLSFPPLTFRSSGHPWTRHVFLLRPPVCSEP